MRARLCMALKLCMVCACVFGESKYSVCVVWIYTYNLCVWVYVCIVFVCVWVCVVCVLACVCVVYVYACLCVRMWFLCLCACVCVFMCACVALRRGLVCSGFLLAEVKRAATIGSTSPPTGTEGADHTARTLRDLALNFHTAGLAILPTRWQTREHGQCSQPNTISSCFPLLHNYTPTPTPFDWTLGSQAWMLQLGVINHAWIHTHTHTHTHTHSGEAYLVRGAEFPWQEAFMRYELWAAWSLQTSPDCHPAPVEWGSWVLLHRKPQAPWQPSRHLSWLPRNGWHTWRQRSCHRPSLPHNPTLRDPQRHHLLQPHPSQYVSAASPGFLIRSDQHGRVSPLQMKMNQFCHEAAL